MRPGVLFDVDGTLLDTNYLHVVAWWQAVRDVEAARQADLPCIALTCGGIGAAELTDAGAAAVYADPAQLLDHLDGSPLARLTTR